MVDPARLLAILDVAQEHKADHDGSGDFKLKRKGGAQDLIISIVASLLQTGNGNGVVVAPTQETVELLPDRRQEADNRQTSFV